MTITFHILSNPNNPVNINNRIDPFSISVLKFIQHMQSKGWRCIHYGIPGCQVSCETVLCLDTLSSDQTLNKINYNKTASIEIGKRKNPNDVLLCFYGLDNQQAANDHSDLTIVEPSIGYDHTAIFSPYRIFTSYAIMHMFYGYKGMLMNPSWWDAVIPNGIDPAEFDYNDKKDDYILFFGRVIESKGIHLAIQATEAAGKKLVIAGPGSFSALGYSSTPKHVTIVGICDKDMRKTLMKNAKAIIGPTYYVEPFGNMIAEGYFAGTPAITTDWGGFTETVVNGVTGYRCREFKEFVNAIHNIDTIDNYTCQQWAMKNFSDEVVYKKHHEYFSRLLSKNFYRL